MDKKDINFTNSTDFQAEFDKNLPCEHNDTQISMQAMSSDVELLVKKDSTVEGTNSNSETKDITEDNSIVAGNENTTNSDSNPQSNGNILNVEQLSDDSATINFCKLDKTKDEKLKNLNFICVPFILASIVISLFNIGKVRYPLSFLFLALGLLALSITSFIRSKIIAKTCDCKQCAHQSRATMKFSFFYGFAALGLLGVFIYFLVTGNQLPTI